MTLKINRVFAVVEIHVFLQNFVKLNAAVLPQTVIRKKTSESQTAQLQARQQRANILRG